MTRALPPTTIVVPTLNEAAAIGGVMRSLLRPEDDFVLELIVADGGSTDATRAIVSEAAARDPRIRLLDNPLRLQGAGVNSAVRAADPRAEVILRADAHMRYPEDFTARSIAGLMRSGGDSLVVRMRTIGEAGFQRAVAAVSNSRIGTGGSAHRSGGRSGFVDHGHHAAFKRKLFSQLGGYDEAFVANEDAEFDARIRDAGGRIWFENDIVLDYFPRRAPAALARQYWRYGMGRARTLLKHRERPRLRQMMPPLLVLGLLAALLLAPLSPWFLLAPALYLATITAAGLGMAIRDRDLWLASAPLALAVMHFCWGTGFLYALATEGLAREGLGKDCLPSDG